MSDNQKQRRIKKSTRAFLIALVILIFCSLLNWGIISDWGKVKIDRINLIGDDGLTYSALLYVPDTATNENPAPAIYMIHGGSGNARNHESWAMEFARRGYVAMAVDWLGGGDGETYNTVENTHSIMDFDNGVHTLFVNYLVSMPIVDAENLITSGHSLGCGAAAAMAMEFNAKALMTCGGGSRVSFKGNSQTIYGDAEFTPLKNNLDTFAKALNKLGYEGVTSVDDLEIGKTYGSFEQGNAKRFMVSHMQRHEAAFFNRTTIGWLIEFADQSVGRDSGIAPDNQIWVWKEIVGLVGIFAYAAFLIAFALLMIDHFDFFRSIRQPMTRNIGLRKGGMAISYAAGIIFPLIVLLTGSFGIMKIFGSGLAENKVALFQLGHTSKAMTVTIGMSLLGILMLILYMKTEGKKQNAKMRDLGLTSEGSAKLDWALIGKAFLLAVITIIVGQTYLALQTDVLGTELYCIIFSMKELPLIKLHYYIPYIIVWMLCFIVTSISLNVERRLPSTGDERKDEIIAVAVNAFVNLFTITLVIIIQNHFQVRTGGSGFYVFQNWGMEINRLWGMPVGMAIAGGGQTLCYRRTGNIWLGVFLIGAICAIMACNGGTSMTAIVQTAF